MTLFFFYAQWGTPNAPAQTEDEKKNLIAQWSGQRSIIVTGHIKYRQFRTGSALAQTTLQELHDLLASTNLKDRPDDLKTIMSRLSSDAEARLPPRCESFFDGSKIRENYEFAGTKQSQVVRNGTQAYQNPENNSVSLTIPGPSSQYIQTIQAFRFIPQDASVNLPLIKRQKGRFFLGNNGPAIETGLELDVDSATGAAYRLAVFHKGELLRETLQDYFITYPGGIIFPSLSIEADFADGKINFISISWIEEAKFNTDLPRDTFNVSVPAGTNLFDRRVPHRVSATTLKEPVADAIDAAKVLFTPQITNNNNWKYVGLILLCIIPVTVWLFWLRRRSSALT